MYDIQVMLEFVHQQDDLSGIFGKSEFNSNLPVVKWKRTFTGGSLENFHASETYLR